MKSLKQILKHFYNLIQKRKLVTVLNQNKNIVAMRQKIALEETAVYINNNMQNIQSLDSKDEILKYTLTKCPTDGLYLEFGVYSGSTINLLSHYLRPKIIYGFDSFEGLPENWRDGFPSGKFKVNKLPKVNKNVRLIKGWYSDTLPLFLKDHQEDAAFIHIDCDLYSSTKTIFDNLKDRIKSGTVIVFDEYFNYPGWQKGEFKAFQEFIIKNNVKYNYLTYNNQHEQVAIIIK